MNLAHIFSWRTLSAIFSQVQLRRALCVLFVGLLASATASAAGATYTYDNLGRLKSVAYDDGTSVTYNLDSAGNRTSVATVLPLGMLQLNASSYSIGEAAASLTVTVIRINGSNGTASINYATSNGTALAGADYTSASGTLNWANGDSADKTFVVPIINDAIFQGNLTFTVTLSGASGAAAGAPAAAIATIVDDESPPTGTLQLGASTYSVAENGSSLTITVTRVGGSSGAASINYATSNGTALAGSDYTSTSGTLNWAAADSANKTFTIPILDDALVEGDEAFTVTLSGTTGAAAGTPAAATITITDWETGSLQLVSPAILLIEAAGTVPYTVSRVNGSSGAASVLCSAVSGTAAAGADFTNPNATLSWVAGEATSKTCSVPIIDDTIHEGPVNESFTVQLSGASGAALGSPSGQVVGIIDDDPLQDTSTMTQGQFGIFGTSWTGFNSTLAVGSMSPTTTSDGKMYGVFNDYAPGGPPSGVFGLKGLTADPGQAWLVSATGHGVTKTGASAAYTYSGGIATWSWTTTFGFTPSGTTVCTIVHN
jgi:hypothetical protein